MFHFSWSICKKTGIPFPGVFLLLLTACILNGNVTLAADSTPPTATNHITAVAGQLSGTTLDIHIKGSATPAYTVYELFKPARIVVDVANAELDGSASVQLDSATGISVKSDRIVDATPALTRFTFTLPKSLPFSVTEDKNDIVLTIKDIAAGPAANGKGGTEIQDIKVDTTPTQTIIRLLGNGPVDDFKYDVLPKNGSTPPRLYIDINNVTGKTLLREQKIGTAVNDIRVAERGSGLRVVFDASGDAIFPFEIKQIDNGLEVRIKENQAEMDQLSTLITEKQSIESQLPKVEPLKMAVQESPSGSVTRNAADKMKDAFSFSGYNKKRISVDFYKIDLHNVFRLLREVSGVNIVVDEAVNGSLTLALNDVPWDFALDIILNLKDLQKIERFNTLVILPKGKSFNWPERAEDNLSFEPDTTVTAQEAIIIQQRQNMSKELIKAKQLIGQARKLEKKEEYESAIRLYEEALTQWSDNARLANRIASIYLVRLHQNAKAVFYARKALKIDARDTAAALNAAIGLANMEEYTEAQQYFDQCVSVPRPESEALLSYAVFSEERKKYEGAVKLLKKHDSLYGQDLNSMVAMARVLDKMGKHEAATEEYRAILLSGFRIPPDLIKYIQGRIALSQSM